MLYLVAQSCPTPCDPMDCSPPGSSVHGDSPGKNTGVGCHALLQGIFLTQGSNPGLPHCRCVLYHLSHQGNPNERIIIFLSHKNTNFLRAGDFVYSASPVSTTVLDVYSIVINAFLLNESLQFFSLGFLLLSAVSKCSWPSVCGELLDFIIPLCSVLWIQSLL